MANDKIKQIVVLMMENRSFDHMLGFAKSGTWPIEGLATTDSNNDSADVEVQVSNDANFGGDLTPDPRHSGF